MNTIENQTNNIIPTPIFKRGFLNATLIDSMGNDLAVVNAARISLHADSKSLSDRDTKLINYLAKHQHMTPFEHCVAKFLIECPLFIRSQIHRHRTFSYNEVSRRYTSENISFYIPQFMHEQAEKNRQGSLPENIPDQDGLDILIKSTERAKETYDKLIYNKVSREEARMTLPQNSMTSFFMTGNLRNWAHFIGLRSDFHSQYEVRLISDRIKEIMSSIFPISMSALLPKDI